MVVIVIVTVVLVILMRKRNNRKRYGRYVSLNIFTDNQYVQVVSINVRQYRRGNLKWTIQRNWQHRITKTQVEDKQNTKSKHNMCWTPPYTRHKTKFSPSEYIRSFPFLLGVIRVAQSFVFCIAICRPLFVYIIFFLFVIELLALLRFIAFDYHLVF